MIHAPALLDRLSGFATEPFDGEVFRATRRSLDPLAASSSGGRWAPSGVVSVLYTSLLREGALAEISFHWSQLTPVPSKPAVLHRLVVSIGRRLRLLRADLEELDVDVAQYETVNYRRTQEIGAAVAFLGCDGLIVLPHAGSARTCSSSRRTTRWQAGSKFSRARRSSGKSGREMPAFFSLAEGGRRFDENQTNPTDQLSPRG